MTGTVTDLGPVVATPLRTEQAALRNVVPGVRVQRTGRGLRPSVTWARSRPGGGPVIVAGVGGALTEQLRPGDLVVATEVRGGASPLACLSAPLLAGALRRHGLTAHLGPVVTSPGVVTGAARRDLGRTGALAVDTESAALAPAAGGGPLAVVRSIVDTPGDPLWHPGMPARGLRALRSLRAAGPALAEWAAALGPREVVLAGPRSLGAGVDRAIDVRALAVQTDLVLVLGSADSANSVRLVEVADRAGCPAHLVADATHVDLRWLTDATKIGITAGASAPPHLVQDLVRCLSGLGPVHVREEHVTDEDVSCTVPQEVS